MRRSALVLCLLLLTPVSGAWSLPEIPDVELEEEWIVEQKEGWGHTGWVALRSEGLEPLRQISATEVLVWGDHGTYQLEVESVLRGPTADGYRVVLEPRLPSHAQWDILSTFEFEALQLAGTNSALPTSFEIHGVDPVIFDSVPGIWWVEPLLETKARNSLSSSIMENGSMNGHPGWDLGLNGSGVIIGVADSGIELDHACFSENATEIGEVGVGHRKVVLVNTSIDDGDHSGQADYKHGTHIAGTLVCDLWNGNVSDGMSPSHGARVLFQDVVNESGWSEPTVDWLLAEAVANGVVIHSDSWGDDTEAYTLRSAEFDLWHREMPWSLAFIAPGNNPSKFYEPANARNVVSVGGTLSDNSTDLYTSSSQGPTEEGLRGNFIATPAVGIISASADGNLSSFNDDMRSSTGTSMSTPLGASITAVIQQMVQDGWFTEEGFVPSGPQLRALLALSSDSLPVGVAPDAQQGWGRPNLANIIDYDENSSANIWIHDSYMMNETIRMGLIDEWLAANGSRPLEQVIESKWNGSDAQGPFLKQGENTSWNLTLIPGEDLEVILSFNQRPFGAVSDDLGVSVILPNGTVIRSNESLEGTEYVHLLAADLIGVENVTIRVDASLVGIGNYSGVLGSDGDMLGFALAVKGVGGEVVVPEPEPVSEPEDGDEDGVPDEEDGCPNTEFEYRNMVGYDGCIPEPMNYSTEDVFVKVEWVHSEHNGMFILQLNGSAAPIHVDNFRQHVENGRYNGTLFHRVIDNFMIQGGDFETGEGYGGYAARFYQYCNGEYSTDVTCAGLGQSAWTVPAELNNGLDHVPYALSMARTSAPNSAGSQFFIVDKDAYPDWLDGEYSVFGKVISGYEGVEYISTVGTGGMDRPVDNVMIISMGIIDWPLSDDNDATSVIDEGNNTNSSEGGLQWRVVGAFFAILFVVMVLISIRKRSNNG
ncbi:MAG: peptidylprolyl isomerase [Candidatus Thalassarchaeaceae archaeon]|nr:peptidylprolyl isomerase [Candidatus Thalassarchaeaceae archaeon]